MKNLHDQANTVSQSFLEFIRKDPKLTIAAIGLTALGAFSSSKLIELNERSSELQVTTQNCVADVMGVESVYLPRHPETGFISRPESVIKEVDACIRANGNASEAHDILNTPLELRPAIAGEN